jgi:prepilin-type N-terminal cleavage/methylation domain-containing protein
MKARFLNNRGFTLMEILIVIALTVIVMGLVFGPVVQTFNFTRRAEVMVRAQDNARLALSVVSRDLANAMYVYDNTETPINFPVVNRFGNPILVPVIYAKVDLVLPRMRGYCPNGHTPGGEPRGDIAAPVCSVCKADLELKPVEPLAPDNKIVRYFVGLRDPARPYCNAYLDLGSTTADDNMYVLYRVEFSPTDARLFDNPSMANFNANLDDPNFFYGAHAAAWKQIARPIVTIPDTDLVTFAKDNNGDVIPTSVTPTVRFMPTAVYNDPLVPTMEADDDAEHPDTPPTMYKATYGHWVLPYAITIEPDRSAKDPADNDYYFQAERGHGGGKDPTNAMCVYRYYRGISHAPVFVFNISHYMATQSGSLYGVGEILQPDDDEPQRAFTVDYVRGIVNFAFPVGRGGSISGSQTMTVSETATTDVINSSFTAMYPYRYIRINEPPTEQILLNSTIVPTSVKVLGPDATPGGLVDDLVLYNRLPFLLYDPSKNQYVVDPYHDEATGTAEIRFDASQTYSGAPLGPLPAGKNVYVYYEVQNNKKGDALRASYTTKSLMTVVVGAQVYDSGSARAEMTELTNKVRLKNIRT